MAGEQPIKLATRDWLWLITTVVGAAIANMSLMYTTSHQLRGEMLELDRRWQERTIVLTREIKSDLKTIQNGIPPDWFRKMVEEQGDRQNEQDKRMNELDKQITKILSMLENGND